MFSKSELNGSVKSEIAVHQAMVSSAQPGPTARSKLQLQSKNPPAAQNSINTALAQFDELPNSAFVRLPVVLGLFSCSKATLWRWVKFSMVPSPRKIGKRITAWNVGQLRQTLKQMDASGQTGSKMGGK